MVDWWSQPDEKETGFCIAWTGESPRVRQFGRKIRLFKSTWDNPHPTVPIRDFDFTSEKPIPSSPFLVAVTAEL
jgi:hypothetical protein